jgi:hypothetical protein
LPNEPLSIYIGWDSREPVASHVAAHSIIKRTEAQLKIRYLKHRELRKAGHFKRHWGIDANTGNFVDYVDGRPFSTEFSHTRFLVPFLNCYQGWALFMDADMVFQCDVKDLFALCDDKYAVMVVKHNHKPKNGIKMDGRVNDQYHRKNWSSFVLFNCSHPANRMLTKERVSFLSGADLHSFNWLTDNQIGVLPHSYNYIAGTSPVLPSERKNIPHVIHYTDGGPWFDECQDVPYALTWVEEYEDWQRNGDTKNKICEIESTRYE